MNTPSKKPVEDVRDLLREKGASALQACPATAWSPGSGPATITSDNATATKRWLFCPHWAEAAFSIDSKFLIQDLLLQGDASVIYGPSNLGKSFFALDLAAHVASGTPYRGKLRVEKSAVIYITLEGRRTFSNRLWALDKEKKIKHEDRLNFFNGAFNLLEPSDSDALVETITADFPRTNSPVRLVVIDTLSRAMPGGDESSSVDMGLVIQAFCKIKEATEAHVMLVHHTGKDVSRGARGHSNLRGAVDTEIEIRKDDEKNLIFAQVTKQRDLPQMSPMAFSLQPVLLGQNNYGENVTSCVVKHEFNYSPSAPTSSGKRMRKSKLKSDDVLNLIPTQGSLLKKIIVARIQNSLNASHRDASAFIEELINAGLIHQVSAKSSSGQNEVHLTREPQ